jgi:hypothetical protein
MTLGFNRGTPPDLLKECVICVGNATALATDSQMDLLVGIGAFDFLFPALLRISPKNLAIALEGILNILQKKPNAVAADRISDEALETILSMTRLSEDVGELSRKILELIPSPIEGVV